MIQWVCCVSKECNGFLLVSLLDPIPLFISNPLLFILSTIILCNHHHCPSSELFSPCRTETLYTLKSNSPFSFQGSAPGDPYSIFCL